MVPSKFPEDLSPHDFEDVHEYPVATATHKAVEVYERLVVSYLLALHIAHSHRAVQEADPDDAPDIVIAGTSR